MGAPKGNKNGRGAKGRSGRKSAYEEAVRAEKLVDVWFDKGITLEDLEKMKEKIKNKKGKLKLWDLFIARSIENDKGRELETMFKKLVPDRVDTKVEATGTLKDFLEKVKEK